jgi:uncharacterized membrane protein HdeD (DUF308 family)
MVVPFGTRRHLRWGFIAVESAS